MSTTTQTLARVPVKLPVIVTIPAADFNRLVEERNGMLILSLADGNVMERSTTDRFFINEEGTRRYLIVRGANAGGLVQSLMRLTVLEGPKEQQRSVSRGTFTKSRRPAEDGLALLAG